MGSPAVRSVKGLVALVTGGSSGLGRGVVERLVRQEARVLMVDLPSSKGAEVAKEIGPASSVDFHAADVSSEEAKAAVSKVIEKFGRLDLLVNCAGIGIARQTYNFNKSTYHDLNEFMKCLQVNVGGTFNMIRLAAPAFGRNDPGEDGVRGVVVNTSSVAAFDGQQGQAAYSASKGAIAAMTLPIARDFSKTGIRVVTIAPGLYDTPMLASLPEKVRAYLSQLVPFPARLGRPDEFAHAVQWVFENPMINGEGIRLDGALRMPP